MLRIKGGRVVDPAHGRDEIGDVCVDEGRIVASLPASAPVLDARHLVVMAGAVDPHTHVAGPAVGAARLLRPEDGGVTLPTLRDTGRRYALMGYTTIMEAAVAPSGARAAHEELDAIPIVDKGIYVLLGNNALVLDCLRDGRVDDLRRVVAWSIEAARAYGVKVANPGGVEAWKCGRHEGDAPGAGGGTREATDGAAGSVLDAPCGGVTPRQIVRAIGGAAADLGLPHPMHLHMNGLGRPGNAAVSLATLEALSGLPAHVTHLQFHAYGGRTMRGWRSRAADLAAWINAHPGPTFDAGQVVFGPATTITADAPAQHRLHRATGRKWLNLDIEGETGCGVVPHVYREDDLTSAVQWAIGLELMLLVADPWRIFLTTDHPNGGAFTSYPDVIRLLMDRGARQAVLRRLHPRAARRTALAGIEREYSLSDIAIVTRAGPARALGLDTKGHLGPGADADVVLYRPADDKAAMFAAPVLVVKDGVVVARDGAIVDEPAGRTLHAALPEGDRPAPAFLDRLRRSFDAWHTTPFEEYPVPPGAVARAAPIPARAPRRP